MFSNDLRSICDKFREFLGSEFAQFRIWNGFRQVDRKRLVPQLGLGLYLEFGFKRHLE